MKITAIESSVVSLPFDMGGPHARFDGQVWDHLEILLVKVETDDGLVGWGEAFGHAAIPSTRAAIDTIIAPLMIGRDAAVRVRFAFHSVQSFKDFDEKLWTSPGNSEASYWIGPHDGLLHKPGSNWGLLAW
jgi:L-alanine-DL-glutamate epimerase-like enolase superfamily enzyme